MSVAKGVELQPGTYSVQPYSGNGHIYLTCSSRTSAFEISLAGSTLLFAVSVQACALHAAAVPINTPHLKMTVGATLRRTAMLAG